ncbi:cyclic dehypoxanthinyl futalosine synthase [Seleniivibrio woodruffii]|uniref:Cyclic dehypoxanthine futalosine synthase n=1 Tax=Seleniivibrio woodruffii TaxID=1078050 RepID=A0A4R1KB85_9BACT|nr:cyclic dehypoxanthinyl futalosine synthase [Seleniivibrio woodruffii]TCK61722.1 cyclic dehypoxanthinyl futalosine synthase [Seleniivibrio woodruffii]TVZ35163.1 de-hypoxanthine futalosine cyclase [Seleniivibrio woodruffii]
MSRTGFDDACRMLAEADFYELAQLADDTRKRLHPEGVVAYVIDRNINYTNICTCKCSFCAFYRDAEDDGAYVISKELLKDKIDETKSLGGTQILLQGGLHPDLGIEFYEDMLSFIREQGVWIHGLSAPEINHIAKLENLSVEETIKRLVKAGLNSIPGAGAELLVDSERRLVSPNKISSDKWLSVMETAHGLGLKTTATMMFKKTDKVEHIIEHFDKIRSVQDRTGGFTAFIPWPYQPANTELGGENVSAVEYLRLLAVARIYLDNVPNIQVSWVTQGPKIGQTALRFGGNDFGSLMIEENVVAACGVGFRMSIEEINNNIRKAGFRPAQRDMEYNILRYFD